MCSGVICMNSISKNRGNSQGIIRLKRWRYRRMVIYWWKQMLYYEEQLEEQLELSCYESCVCLPDDAFLVWQVNMLDMERRGEVLPIIIYLVLLSIVFPCLNLEKTVWNLTASFPIRFYIRKKETIKGRSWSVILFKWPLGYKQETVIVHWSIIVLV